MKVRQSLQTSISRRFYSLTLLTLALTGCGTSDDPDTVTSSDLMTKTAILSGAQIETPVVTNATGFGTVTVDATTHAITGGVSFSGMTATTAHIHTGAAGASGAAAVTLNVDNMTHTATIPTGTTLTHAQYEDLMAGNLYFNIHSATNTGGEIRGQIGRVVMTAALAGTQNVPAVTTTASGTARVVVDPSTMNITGGVSYTDVTATTAHIHTGAAGANGAAAVTLTVDNTMNTATVPASTTLTQTQYDDLLMGKLYFNVHSAANAAGEIRGQIGPVAMVATLDGAQEVPAVTTTASGKAVFVVDPVTRMLSGGVGYTGVTATSAHIHTGATGATGAAAVTLTVDSNTNTATVPANTVLTQTQYDDMLAGNLYVNVHSTTFSSGEIRGQIGVP